MKVTTLRKSSYYKLKSCHNVTTYHDSIFPLHVFEMRLRGCDMSKGKTLDAKNYLHLIMQTSAINFFVWQPSTLCYGGTQK